MNSNINYPQCAFLDETTGKPVLPWLLWLQNPNFASIKTANAINPSSGGTGSNATPENGQLLIGNGSSYTLAVPTTSTGISITTGPGSLSFTNTGVISFSAGTTGLTPIATTTGNVLLDGTLNIANGGTGATTAAQARTNLGITSGVYAESYQTATANQTVFTISAYTVGNNSLKVYVNGNKQIRTVNYNETNTTTITFVSGLNVGDLVEFVV